MKTFHLKVVTPYGKPFEEEIYSLHIKTTGGYLTILPSHYPLITTIVPSVLKYSNELGETKFSFVGSGIMKVNDKDTELIISAFEKSEDIDVDRATKAKQRAEERLNSKDSNIDHQRAEIALKRALARLDASSHR